MPAQIIHILHGVATIQKTIELVRNAGKEALSREGGFLFLVFPKLCKPELFPWFCLGCQGPDLFYHNQRTRPFALEYGSLLHRHSYGDFSLSLLENALKYIPDDNLATPEVAFAIGFLLHPFPDRLMHPYIVYKSGSVSHTGAEIVKNAQNHIFLERILDMLFLEWSQDSVSEIVLWSTQMEYPAVCSFPQTKLLSWPARNAEASIRHIIIEALMNTFPKRANKDKNLELRIQNMFQDASHFYELTDPGYFKRNSLNENRLIYSMLMKQEKQALALAALLYPFGVTMNADFLNMHQTKWHNPCEHGFESNDSVPELFIKARDEATVSLLKILKAKNFAADIPVAIGNESLSLNDASKNRCNARRFDRFELDALLRLHLDSVSNLVQDLNQS